VLTLSELDVKGLVGAVNGEHQDQTSLPLAGLLVIQKGIDLTDWLRISSGIAIPTT
jgi:hypothetical protein